MKNLSEIGQGVLAKVRQLAPKARAEAFLVESENRVCEWSEGAPENRTVAQTGGLGLRLIQEDRLGFGYTNRWASEDFEALARQAIASSASTAPDAGWDIPESAQTPSGQDLQLVDQVLAESPWDGRYGFLTSMESEVKKRDKRIAKVLRGTYRESRSRVAVVNTRGVSSSYDSTQVSFGMACVAVDQGETQLGYAFQAKHHFADLQPAWVIDKAVEHTVSLLGGKRIPSGRYDLVLDPFVAAEMLELLAGALRADQVQKGKSFLAAKVGQQIAAPSLTLVDHGCFPRGLGSSPVDAEGVPTQRTVLLDHGVLKGFLFDTYTARKGKRSSTGNAGRASYKGVPEPEASNFFWEAGTPSPEKILSAVKSGIYVRSVMGLHTVDTISGDFSLGIMGERIENGVRTHAVRGITIAGNLLELLRNVEAVGSDLSFMGSIGSPTIWVRDISVGGL